MAAQKAVLKALNTYTGTNLWQDVLEDILTQDEWDDAPHDRFTHNGTQYVTVVTPNGTSRWMLLT